MNDLERYFENNTGRMIHKWMHYFDVYDSLFSKFRGTDVHFVEIGTGNGGSMQMWHDYFGPKAKFYGVDIHPYAENFADERTKIFIGDQGDKKFLKKLAAEIPRIDILLDDGGHTMEQQINTFEVLYPKIELGGVYLCEDLHTSYWKGYGGGYKRRGSFIEYTKNFIDYINAHHSKWVMKDANQEIVKTAFGLHYYDSMFAIEKRAVGKPYSRMTGTATLPPEPEPQPPLMKRIKRALKKKKS